MITLKNINLSSIDLSSIDLRGIKLGLGGRGGGSSDGFPQLPGDVTRWHFGGLTNEMMAAMDDPRIEDADGKGRFLSFKNLAWGGMSGVGGYADNWNSSADWAINSYWVNSHTDHKLQFIKASSVVQARSNNIYNAENVYKNILNVNGLTEAVNKGSVKALKIIATDPITSKAIKTFSFETDGVIQISFDDVLQDYYVDYFLYGSDTKDIDITIEQLPLYPGALVFDGVDDYGVCENFPILTKEKGYTVVALRQWISMGEGISGLVSNVKNWFNDGAFVLEYFYTKNLHSISFGAIKSEKDLPHILTYQTSKSYNGVSITPGSFKGTDVLHVGKLAPINIGNYANAAIWELVFLDHDATEEELTKIKNYFIKTYPWLFFDQAWTVTGKTNEDTDRATIANITGNGNNLVLSNFGFAGNSGYGEYAYNWNKWGVSNGDATNVSKQYNKFVAVMPVNQSISTCSLYSTEVSTGTKFQFKLKITGLTTNWTVRVMERYTEGANIIYEFDKDGTYQIDHTMTGSGNQLRLYIRMYCAVPNTEGTTVTIEQIPEYEGYLVTDGVDDKVESSPFTLNKDWTIVGNWTMLSNIPSNCGIIKVSSMFLYNSLDGVTIYFAGGPIKIQSKSINAFCSDGRIYLNDWTEILKPDAQIASGGSKSSLNIASYSANFTKMAFKNLAIYDGKNLSKDDCIKAYNYLQTLKAK